MRWGYPYVMDDFGFHMTLTGQVPEERVDADEGDPGPSVLPRFTGRPLSPSPALPSSPRRRAARRFKVHILAAACWRQKLKDDLT